MTFNNIYYKILESDALSVWLDDERDPSEPAISKIFGSTGNEIWVKTAHNCIDLLKTGNVYKISLDHDLGNEEEVGNGYDVARFIEEQAFLGKLPPLEWRVHSRNRVAAERMSNALRNADRFWNNERKV